MGRTYLFRAVKRALGGAVGGSSALSRRHFLITAAAAAACRPVERAPALGATAIVGAGAAGLTIAYRLNAAGQPATLYEAGERLGGRMFTRRDFTEEGLFCELGGEFVDTNHTALISLARELGVGIERLSPPGAADGDYYHFGDWLYSAHDMVRGDGVGGFTRIAEIIAADQDALLDAEENWTERARALDQMSLKAYLDGLRARAPRWAIDLLDTAYLGEFGIPTDQQSALNLVDFISADVSDGFKIFGESDEAWRIAGGSSTLIEALAARLGDGAALKTRFVLRGAARTETGVKLSFDTPQGLVESEHPRVVFALPFTKLRAIEGIDTLGLGADTLRAIRELGYGDNAKLMVATNARPWRDAAGLPRGPASAFYSDRFQVAWDSSRAQPGVGGVLTNFLSGQDNREAALSALTDGMQRISPAIAAALDPTRAAWMAWRTQPFALGSYAGALVGQYTTLLEATAAPSEDGRIHLAGEHTSADFIGFMNGAVESGERCAAALLMA